MSNRKKIRVKSLVEPRGIKQIRARGIRPTEGTTVRVKIEESGLEEKILSFVFHKDGYPEQSLLANDNIDLSLLPRATVSFRTLANATKNDLRGMDLFNLGTLAFEVMIEDRARLTIELGTRVRSKIQMVRLSIGVGKYSTSAACRLTGLEKFVEAHGRDADPERDGEEQ